MSAIEDIDKRIYEAIDNLVHEHGRVNTSPERKAEIANEIAIIRVSMTPQCNCKED